MPIRKKQRGGIIDNPTNCNNDTTPVDLDDISGDSDIIYVGNKLAGDKYNCFKPSELKEIILQAIKERKYPQNPLNRENLSEELIERIVAMYPDEFENIVDMDEEIEEEEEDIELDVISNVSPNDMIPILLPLFRITSTSDRRHETRIKTLKEVLKNYDNPNDPANNTWNKWYNNSDIPMDYKNAMINLFKLFADGFRPNMKKFSINLLGVDLIELINYPATYGVSSDKNFKFHYIKIEDNIEAIAITYTLDVDESVERLNAIDDNDIEDSTEWTVYKLATIATTGLLDQSEERTNEFLTKIIGTNTNKKLLVISYDSDIDSEDEEYTDYVTNILDFYNVEGVSEDYAEFYSTYDNDNEKLYIGKEEQQGGSKKKKSKRVVYKRRSSKKKSSKRKSKKTSKKKSKKRSHQRRK
jgi:hypothetical protein